MDSKSVQLYLLNLIETLIIWLWQQPTPNIIFIFCQEAVQCFDKTDFFHCRLRFCRILRCVSLNTWVPDKSALLNREEATEKYICVVGIIELKSSLIRELSEELGDLSHFISLFHCSLILSIKIQGCLQLFTDCSKCIWLHLIHMETCECAPVQPVKRTNVFRISSSTFS